VVPQRASKFGRVHGWTFSSIWDGMAIDGATRVSARNHFALVVAYPRQHFRQGRQRLLRRADLRRWQALGARGG
jgi:hypothetical protein